MALTIQQVLQCRELLAEHEAKLVGSADSVLSTTRGTLHRYWSGITEDLHDQCRQFLKSYISANNADVVQIAGTLSPYDVSGSYYYAYESANGYPVRRTTNNDFTLKVAVSGSDYYWQISNEWDEVLYTSDSQAGTPVDIDDAVWTAAGNVLVDLSDGRIMEDFFVMDDAGPYYTTTGTPASATIVASTGIYATVVDPMVEQGKVREGTYRGGEVSVQRERDGTFSIYQTLELLNEDLDYVLLGYGTPGFFKREFRLYPDIPEASMASLIETLSTHPSYIVEDVKGNKTRNSGVYDVYLTLLHIPDPEVETETSFETNEGGYSPSAYVYFANHRRILDGDGNTFGYQLYQDSAPTAHNQYAFVRKVTVVRTKTYSKAEPSAGTYNASASGVSSTSSFNISGGKKMQLPNGMWVKETVSIIKGQWGITA